MPARTAGLLLWLTLGGLAVLSLVWRIGNPPRPPMIRPPPPPELPAVAPLERFQLSPPDWYGEMASRPLFLADRRPEPPPPPDEATPEKPPVGSEQKFMLFGVMIAPGTQAALLRLAEPNAKTARIKQGELIGEWRLDAVFPDRVVLRKGQATQDLPLTRPRKPAKPRVRRAAAQPGQQDTVPPAQAPAGPGGVPAMPQPGVVDVVPPPVIPAPPQ